MKNLKEIAQLVKEVKLKETDLLSTKKSQQTKTTIFYEKILTKEFSTDSDAATYFFNSDTNHSSYKKLKYQLREKLINILFFYEPKNANSDREKGYIYCCKYMFIAKILARLNAQKTSTDIAKKVLQKALEFELTEFIVESSRLLRNEYGLMQGNEKQYHFYNQVFKKHKNILNAESLAEEFYNILILPYTHSKAIQDTTAQRAETFHQQLIPFLEKYSSPYLHLVGNIIIILAKLSKNEYDSTVELCKKAISFFEKKTYSYKTAMRVFSHNLLICYIQLKKYQEGKAIVIKSLDNVRFGTHSWFVNKELHLTLALHSKEYFEAYLILIDVLKNIKVSSTQNVIQERWLIYKVYIEFLIFIEEIEIDGELIGKVKLGKFLNSVPLFSKDKRGLNIPILIIQILFMIVKKDYDQSIDRIEAIKKYCTRYLVKDKNFRSNCFINMLLQIPMAGFRRSEVKRKAKKYLDQLESTPLEFSNQASEIEIIPYEDLWGFIIESI